MFPLQTRLKLYLVLSLMIYAVTVSSIFILDLKLAPILSSLEGLDALLSQLNGIYLFIIILSIIAFLYGTLILVFTFLRGINKYREIVRRLDAVEERGDYDLASIEFQPEDEFGNIGRTFNDVIARLRKFDSLKVQRIKIEAQKFEMLAEEIPYPVMVINTEGSDKTVSYYNKHFRDTFAVRHEEEQSKFFDLKNVLLSALNIQDDVEADLSTPDDDKAKPIERFIDEEFIHAIELAVTTRTATTIKKDMHALEGKTVYHSDSIRIVPVWDDFNKVHEVVIIFEKIRKK